MSAIAKGYGVDKVAEVVANSGCKNYMVEIGGEVVTAGVNKLGEAWRIGIQKPVAEAGVGYDNVMVIKLKDKAIATSGDYRNFFKYKGKNYSHILDPRTGYPADANVASASVIANSCSEADGLATSLMVMGVEHGLNMIEKIPGVEALIYVRLPDGSFKNSQTSGFGAFVVE